MACDEDGAAGSFGDTAPLVQQYHFVEALPPAVDSVTSRITFPGLIQPVSLMAHGSFRFRIRLESSRAAAFGASLLAPTGCNGGGSAVIPYDGGPGDAGKTGSWRVLRPVMDPQACTPAKRNAPACYICWLYCPDGVISRTVPPRIDYQYCKGCLRCTHICKFGALVPAKEAEQDMDKITVKHKFLK